MRLRFPAFLLVVILLAVATFVSAFVSFQRAQSIDSDALRAWYYIYPFIPMGIVLFVAYGLWRVRRDAKSS